MFENTTDKELIQELADKGIEFEIPDEMLKAVSGGAGGRANIKALVDNMRDKLIGAKKYGISKEQYLSAYRAIMEQARVEHGEDSDKFLIAQEHYTFIQENWDIL